MNDSEQVLYGTRIGDEDWQEQIICTKPEHFMAARAWAKDNGFDRLRIATIDLRVNPLDTFRNSAR